jgi:hypothetical protein
MLYAFIRTTDQRMNCASLSYKRFPPMQSLNILRQLISAWAFTALLPIPILVATNPKTHTDVKCLYLGLASAWFATEVFRSDGGLTSRAVWRDKVLAVLIALTFNVGLFIVLGLSIGVRSGIPFPLMAAFSAIPALGIAPWLSQRVRQQYAVIILGATMVALAKLAACVVVRFVYGPNYVEAGYVAADWQTAKLMISLFWGFTIALSLALLWTSVCAGATLQVED